MRSGRPVVADRAVDSEAVIGGKKQRGNVSPEALGATSVVPAVDQYPLSCSGGDHRDACGPFEPPPL